MRIAILGLASLAAATVPARATAGECDGVTVAVDNDDPGSGYSEENPENFQTHDVDACAGSYRYLSKYVGDESTNGRVIWQPAIATPGTYRVTTSFRASENRTDDADYVLIGDDGQQTNVVIDQRGDGCTQVEVGSIWCVAGGSCRLELDGTDDMKSDAADETVFELIDCEPPPPSPCDPLSDAGFEVCASGPMTCEGVYAGGEGCVVFCATVGMECVARFGGEPGCSQELDVVIPCDEVNDHGSDYCVCMGDPPPATTSGDGGESSDTDPAGTSGGDTAADGDSGGGSTSAATSDASTGGATGMTGDALPGSGIDRGDAGCGCATRDGRPAGVFLVLAVLGVRRRGRRNEIVSI